jgi:hypothetical protein
MRTHETLLLAGIVAVDVAVLAMSRPAPGAAAAATPTVPAAKFRLEPLGIAILPATVDASAPARRSR